MILKEKQSYSVREVKKDTERDKEWETETVREKYRTTKEGSKIQRQI